MTRNAFTVGGYLRDGNDFLLLKHRRLGLWLPPGGRIEANETPIQALWREITEELGHEAAVAAVIGEPQGLVIPSSVVGSGTPLGLLTYEEHVAGDEIHMNFAFIARLPRTCRIVLSDEHDLFAWAGARSELEIPPNVRAIMDRARFAWPEGR